METEITIKVPEFLVGIIKGMAAKYSSVRRWRDNKDAEVEGYYIEADSTIRRAGGEGLVFNGSTPKCIKVSRRNVPGNHCVFATEKQAKAALAMARISQIMANDDRFGGPISDEYWINRPHVDKFSIARIDDKIEKIKTCTEYKFLAFQTREQCDLFMEENMDLIKDYYMLE